MASIYNKNPVSGDQALILEPREGLILPFDFGNWTEIRLGIFCTFVDIDDPNLGRTDTETIDSNFLPRNVFWFGLKDSGNLLPWNTGTYFAGWTAPVLDFGTERSNQLGASTSIQGNFNGCISTSGTSTIRVITSDRFYHFRSTADLPTGFCGFNTISFRRTAGYSGAFVPRGYNISISDVSTDSLRYHMQRYPFNNASSYANTGYFPPELNSIFIYSPFNENRLRIHNILIERTI